MRHLLTTLLLFLALALAAASAAQAIVPPRDCGRMTVGERTYNIKADQLSCRNARSHSRRYLATRRKPTGYSCRRYSASETRLAFRCTRGTRTFFAIRR